MITGSVLAAGDATIAVNVRGPTGAVLEAQVVIDTGFNGYLTLGESSIEFLELRGEEEIRYTLADGSETTARVLYAEIEWHSAWRTIIVVKMDGGPLLGMAMLAGSSLRMDVTPGGRVEIHPLP